MSSSLQVAKKDSASALSQQAPVCPIDWFTPCVSQSARNSAEVYLSIRYTERLAVVGVAPSVGSVGDSYDNALAESVIGLYKTEVIGLQGPWRHAEQVEFATLTWIDWFNHRRLLEPLGHVPP